MVELPVEAAAGPAVGERHVVRGYVMVLTAATLWGINCAVIKVILASGLSTYRIAELRSAGAAVGFGLALAVTRPQAFRARPRELAFLVFFGIAGLALVQWLYYVALQHLEIGIALLLEYLAPLGIALWARFVFHEHVRRRIWLALALALSGLTLVVEIWRGFVLDGLGVAAALGSATGYVIYVLSAEHALRSRDTLSLVFYGFLFSAVFWAIVQPWWGYPGGRVVATMSLYGRLAGLHLPVWALLAWLVVLGTIVPFRLLVGALRHVGATRAGLVATLEPVVAALVAFAWLRESLGSAQIAGGAVVLVAIGLAQSAR
jgi:drug/metabolite transporter (DMT)-like permease